MSDLPLIDRSFREKIVLVGMITPGRTDDEVNESLDELSLLVDTAGADEMARVVQRRDAPDPATYVGKGKAHELHELSEVVDADTVIFDDELSPAQQFNLEKILGRTAIDRTAVILDIFAQNARSQEGKAQVELAQLQYRLPRLRGRGVQMSRQAGAKAAGGARAPIGSRGPGETQLEVDRRRILRRIAKLERDLVSIGNHRATQRKARRRSRLARVAIVGYTNAGKSTLLNRLTDAGVLVEDRLFATLDATTRRLQLPGGETVLLTDTVGFIRKLPHGLVEAFKSTLEVAAEADLLVHLTDASWPQPETPDPALQLDAVRSILEEIGAGDVPELVVFNKTDRLEGDIDHFLVRHPGSVGISARTGDGLDALLLAIGDRLRALTEVVDLRIPYDRGDLLASLHREGEVLVEDFLDDQVRLRVRLDGDAAARFAPYEVDDPAERDTTARGQTGAMKQDAPLGGGAVMDLSGPDIDLAVVADRIRDADQVALACHIHPDGDALGSLMAMHLLCRAHGTNSVASFGSPFAVGPHYEFLPSLSTLTPPDEFPEHPELMITFDSGSVARLGDLGPMATVADELVVVDHHADNQRYGTINVIDVSAAATAVVVRNLARELDWTLDHDIAECLYVGLVTDTGRFQYANTSPAVFHLAEELAEFGLPIPELNRELYEKHRFAYLQLAGAALSRAVLDLDLAFVATWVPAEDFERFGVGVDETEGLIDLVRRTAEASISCVVKETDQGSRVSLRSIDDSDVAALAMRFGGGGHTKLAGFTSAESGPVVIEQLRAALAVGPDSQ